MHIKELAERLQVSTRTIRFYEEKGLLTPSKHPENGYRLFTEQDARRMQTIICLREVGVAVDEIKTILTELDRGGQDEVLYALELQRSMMFSQMLELKSHIQTTDRMIAHLKNNQPLVWEDMFQMAQGLRRIRELRSNWRDHWDFDRQALVHDELVYNAKHGSSKHPGYEQTLRTVVQWVHPIPGEQGLDIGTGTGNLAAQFLAQQVHMVGIDQSQAMLKQCKRKFPSFETRLGNFLAIPYLDHSFDFVVSSYALHHLTDEQKPLALEEMRRVLKPHGRICIADLMFENRAERVSYLAKLAQAGEQAILDQMEQAYYADRSQLLDWLHKNGYVARAERIHDLVHIVYAAPIHKGA